MVFDFFSKNPNFFSVEQRNIKTLVSARESYGDDAIGYVQLKRSGSFCEVRCKICPEHKLRSKAYTVSVHINEEEEQVTDVLCHDCPASAGGCKHAVAFLMWLHRRSEEPACTSVSCYWKKSNLSKVGTSIKVLTTMDMSSRVHVNPAPNEEVMNTFINECKTRNIATCQFIKHSIGYVDKKTELSFHQLMIRYKDEDCASFIEKIKCMITETNIKVAEIATRKQNHSSLWFELRYGRITASKCYEVSRCKTENGSLVAQIFGARSVQTTAMKRGQKLEDKVRQVVQEKLGMKFDKCGLFISNEYPMIAGSPDGINVKRNCLLEIKCPAKKQTMKNYIRNGNLTNKCLAQVQFQMFCAKVNKAYFCVADPDFERTKNVTILPVTFNNSYVQNVSKDLVLFWKSYVFPKLFESISQ